MCCHAGGAHAWGSVLAWGACHAPCPQQWGRVTVWWACHAWCLQWCCGADSHMLMRVRLLGAPGELQLSLPPPLPQAAHFSPPLCWPSITAAPPPTPPPTDYMNKPTFLNNFWDGFRELLGPRHVIKSLEK